MSKMSDLMIEIENLIVDGQLSFSQIADNLGVPIDWVDTVATELMDRWAVEDGETDDGYALASAGFGTDEDYGDYGSDEF